MGKTGRAERVAWALGAVLALASTAVLLSELVGQSEGHSSLLDRIVSSPPEPASGRPIAARVVAAAPDARRRDQTKFDWRSARMNDELAVGDSIFAGLQARTVARVDGGEIALEPGALATFVEAGGRTTIRLSRGKAKVSGTGPMRLEVGGRSVAISEPDPTGLRPAPVSKRKLARSYEVEIDAGPERAPGLRVAFGAASVALDGQKAMALAASQSLALHAPGRSVAAAGPSAVARKDEAVPPPPFPTEVAREWTIDDLYAQEPGGEALIPRRPLPDPIAHRLAAVIAGPRGEGACETEIARGPSFTGEVLKFSAPCGEARAERLFVGENFWRTRWRPGGPWVAGSLTMRPKLRFPKPEFSLAQKLAPFVDGRAEAALRIANHEQYARLIVEIAGPAGENDVRSARVALAQAEARASFSQEGSWYVRVRGVFAGGALSPAGAFVRVDVAAPARLEIPVIAARRERVRVGAPIELAWTRVEGAEAYEIEARTPAGMQRFETRTARTATLFADRAGGYRIRVRALAALSAPSPWSASARVRAEAAGPRLAPLASMRPESVQPESAQPDAQYAEPPIDQGLPPPALASRFSPPPLIELNYRSSALEFGLLANTRFSRQQIDQTQSPSQNALLNARWMQWRGSLGFEALAKAPLAPVGSSSSSSGSEYGAEARVHLRARFASPLPFPRSFQASAFAGAEALRNDGQNLFVSAYDLIKAGVALSFPVAPKLDTGGEFAYGASLKGGRKTEASGFLSAWIARNYSLRGGYRAHFFEAAHPSEAPGGLPYREAYGEVFGAFQCRY